MCTGGILSSVMSGTAVDKAKIKPRSSAVRHIGPQPGLKPSSQVVYKSHASQGIVDDTQIDSPLAGPASFLGATAANCPRRCGASRSFRALGARPRNQTPSQNPCCEVGALASIPARRHRKVPHVSLVIHSFQNRAGRCMNNIVLRDQRWTR